MAYHASIGKRVQSPQATDLVVPEMGEPVDGVDPEYGRPDEEPARRGTTAAAQATPARSRTQPRRKRAPRARELVAASAGRRHPRTLCPFAAPGWRAPADLDRNVCGCSTNSSYFSHKRRDDAAGTARLNHHKPELSPSLGAAARPGAPRARQIATFARSEPRGDDAQTLPDSAHTVPRHRTGQRWAAGGSTTALKPGPYVDECP